MNDSLLRFFNAPEDDDPEVSPVREGGHVVESTRPTAVVSLKALDQQEKDKTLVAYVALKQAMRDRPDLYSAVCWEAQKEIRKARSPEERKEASRLLNALAMVSTFELRFGGVHHGDEELDAAFENPAYSGFWDAVQLVNAVFEEMAADMSIPVEQVKEIESGPSSSNVPLLEHIN